jgi:glycosyltransferase involved in cell wall biosynthesis
MKICLISESESYHTQRWASALAAHGCEVHLISTKNADVHDVKLHIMPIYSASPLVKIRNNHRIEQLIRNLDPDVTHLFGLFPMFSLVNMLLARKLKNLVISVWGSDVVPGKSQESFKDRFIKTYLLNYGDRVLATSKYLARKTQKFINDSRCVDVVPWGVDLKIFWPKSVEEKQEVIKIGFAKRLHALSAPDTLLRAFHHASQNCRLQLKLKIAGDGPMKSQLFELAKNIGLKDSIEWLGWVSDLNSLSDFYRSLDFLVMPSRKESFGVSAVEAAASGLPVIASRIGGIPEVVVNGETGILINSEDVLGFSKAITKLAENDCLRKKLGSKARQRAERHFDWQDSIKRMIAIYQQVNIHDLRG